MYNLKLAVPRILKDGAECSDCYILDWDNTTGLLIFNVTGFSNYTASEGNQSKVQNNGTTNASFYLYMKVQYYNSGTWIDDDVVYNSPSPIIVPIDSVLKLDEYFNDKWNTSTDASYGSGTYRVVVYLRDNESNVLRNIDGSELNATYNFTVTSSNSAPSISQVNIMTDPAYANDTLNCSALPIDGEDSNINVSFTWFVNGVLNNSWDTTVECTNNSWCYNLLSKSI